MNRANMRVAVGLLVALAGPVLAADPKPQPKPWPEFTFRMEKAPKSGAGKRIKVQIAPEAAKPAPPATTAKAAPKAPTTGRYDWYWSHVPAGLGTAGGERAALALAGLGKAPGGGAVAGPRLAALQEIAQAHGPAILRETIGTRVSPALVLAVISVESGGRSGAESHKGAQGLMQLMPATAERFGVRDSADAAQNIKGGVAYLNWLLAEFDNDPVLALAGYNAGEGAVRKHDGVPPYSETRDYIPKVLAAFDVARGLCKTRPELILDACALNLAMK